MKTYRIVPHSGVTNHNRRLWRSIHSMGERVQYDIVFGHKKIEFYITGCERLKRKLENKLAITLIEAELPDIAGQVQEMRYLKHDIFSLNTSASESQTPLSSILNTVDELQEGDSARLSFCIDPEPRKKWAKNAQWTMEKLRKGKIPQRANLSMAKVMPMLQTGFAAIANEVNDFVTDTFQAIDNMFFNSSKKFSRDKVIQKGYGLEDEIHARKLSGASLEKASLPVFRTHIHAIATNIDAMETLTLALAETAGDNELYGKKVKSYKVPKFDPDVNLISTDELSKLCLQLPGSELQRRYAEEMSVKKRVETDIPAAVRNEKNLLIGHAEYKDKSIPIFLPCDQKEEFYSGYTFIGKQGSGKDNAIQNFVYHGAMHQNISFVIPDWICQPGHKGMADGIRDLLPPEKIIDLDLSDENHIIPMDLTEVITKLGRKGASRFGDEMIDFMNVEGLARSSRYLREAAKASGGSLYNIKRIFEDKEYRVQVQHKLIDQGNIRLAQEIENWGDDIDNKIDAIMNRLSMFFGNDTLHDIFAQPPKREVDFSKWLAEGKVIIIRMPKRKLGSSAKVLAHWVTLKVLMTRMLMTDAEKEKSGCFIVINEPEQVESKGMSELMGRIATEGRKERLGSIFAFHHWNKLPDHLQDNLIAGGVNQFLFANDHKDTFKRAAERLQPTFTIEQALQTPKHYAIAILNTKEPLPAFLVHMLPPIPDKDRLDNSFLTKRHAKMYGRAWKDLQTMIQ
ncbi:hypothetical protein Sam112_gp42 [Bacillus phage vB_BcM_Sam112]|uniref:ATP-binding protein n=1 Tax=Bacillus phage vB_BcM_Sam112 TaxID=2663324 RepID=A0A5Q2F8A2_9CAUD|nr:hypothetical protein Sam112_gp42 [Bacillus phage vB_BcM_Sam112]